MTNEDKIYIAEIASFIFGDRINPNDVNQHVADITAAGFLFAVESSNSAAKIPKPLGSRPTVDWLLNLEVKLFWRSAARQALHDMARANAKIKFHSSYEAAKHAK